MSKSLQSSWSIMLELFGAFLINYYQILATYYKFLLLSVLQIWNSHSQIASHGSSPCFPLQILSYILIITSYHISDLSAVTVPSQDPHKPVITCGRGKPYRECLPGPRKPSPPSKSYPWVWSWKAIYFMYSKATKTLFHLRSRRLLITLNPFWLLNNGYYK